MEAFAVPFCKFEEGGSVISVAMGTQLSLFWFVALGIGLLMPDQEFRGFDDRNQSDGLRSIQVCCSSIRYHKKSNDAGTRTRSS